MLSDKIAKSKYPNISKCIGNDGNLTWTTAIGGGISFLESGDKFKVLPFTKQIKLWLGTWFFLSSLIKF